MTVRSLFPILRTRDLPRLVAFYTAAFGGAEQYRWDDVYVSLAVGGGAIGIGLEPEAAAGDQLSIWLYVDDVDAAFGAAIAAGAEAVAEPADMAWGERVAQVRDPDGNPLYLGAPMASASST